MLNQIDLKAIAEKLDDLLEEKLEAMDPNSVDVLKLQALIIRVRAEIV